LSGVCSGVEGNRFNFEGRSGFGNLESLGVTSLSFGL
jgi:hypothetical protein